MIFFDQKMCAWGGPFCAVFLGIGLLMAGFVPPPSPMLSAQEIAALYQSNTSMIRTGMLLGLLGIAGYCTLVGAISGQMRRMQGISRLPPDLQSQCTVLCNTLNETLAKVRDVSAILNPRQLASLGLEASLRAHLLKTLENTPVHWSLECQQRLTGIPEEMAVAAFRITQEAVTNMLRHAQAHNLLVRLQRLPEGLSLMICDDGQGFSPAINPGLEGQRGMAGMSERIDQLGGTLSVNSQPGKGTRIDALFPWAPRALERASSPKVLE